MPSAHVKSPHCHCQTNAPPASSSRSPADEERPSEDNRSLKVRPINFAANSCEPSGPCWAARLKRASVCPMPSDFLGCRWPSSSQLLRIYAPNFLHFGGEFSEDGGVSHFVDPSLRVVVLPVVGGHPYQGRAAGYRISPKRGGTTG